MTKSDPDLLKCLCIETINKTHSIINETKSECYLDLWDLELKLYVNS